MSLNLLRRPLRSTSRLSLYRHVHHLPRPPPSDLPNPETYTSPSKPREYYMRPYTRRLSLPLPSSLSSTPRFTHLILFSIAGLLSWAGFVAYATNQERSSSSVMRQILVRLKSDESVREVLGEGARPVPAWWLNGDTWINGGISLLQGNVDISFRVKGSEGTGTLYFTSIRKEKGQPFSILRYKIICDNGRVIHLVPES